jgi:hypothetical protein
MSDTRDFGSDGGPDGGAASRAAGLVQPAPLRPLRVVLVHASLEHARHTLIVGHFLGSPFSGAEARLDDRMDHRLSRAQLTRDYPGQLGESRYFEGFADTPPPGAVIIGLGPWGELTVTELTAAVTRTLLRNALVEMERVLATRDLEGAADVVEAQLTPASERPGFDPMPLGVSAVLIGTSRTGGLTIESSIRAIVAGVATANLRLSQMIVRQRPDGSPIMAADVVAFGELELIERYEDLVEVAAGVLEQMRVAAERTPQTKIEYIPQPKTGEGAAGQNPPADIANDVWTRVDIRDAQVGEDGLASVTYSTSGQLARADEFHHHYDHQIVDQLIARSVTRKRDPRVGATLYELLLPNDLKQPLGSGTHLQLLVDESTADIPWELLAPRADAFRSSQPLALTGGLLRQLREGQMVRGTITRATERAVLIIGNPPLGSRGAPLQGAVDEAKAVREAFDANRSWAVAARIWDNAGNYVGSELTDDMTGDPQELVTHEVMTGAWRVIHIAAHGYIDPGGNAAASGVVLGAGAYLTPTTIGQLSVIPDLVVVNACHLGSINRQVSGLNRVAASFARKLMQLGVRAVIAAGWAVDDRAAEAFATKLYGELFAGYELGDAVQAARIAAHDAAPDALTWGAYQCYGDPGFRIAPRQSRATTSNSLTVAELRRRIRQAAGMVSDHTSSIAALRHQIGEVLENASEPGWESSLAEVLTKLEADPLLASAGDRVKADVSADLGAAWAELGQFQRAADHLERAVMAGGSDVPIRAIERLANVLVRHATQLSDPALRRQCTRKARHYLRVLDALGPTGEREALWGSYLKKRATMTDSDKWRTFFVDRSAQKYAVAQSLEPSSYHELAARQLGAIATARRAHTVATASVGAGSPNNGADGGRGAPGTPSALAPPEPLAPPSTAPADFWGRSVVGDRMLTNLLEQHLLGQEGDATIAAMVRAYESAFRLRSSGANRRSVIDHLIDVATLVPEPLLATQLKDAGETMAASWLGGE